MNNQNKPINDDLKRLRAYWDERADSLDDNCAKVEQSQRTQRMRFEAFITQHQLDGKSILDVGCGTGDLWSHLKRHNLKSAYMGVDLSPKMIEVCQRLHPDAQFEAQDILTWDAGRTFDYTISIGIHNIKIENGWELLKQVTARQFELCSVAAHLSLLSDRYQQFADHIQPWAVEQVLAFALTLTPFVLVQHHYLPHDFSITLYRQPIIDTRADLLLDDEAAQ